jgi:hypothetical protein
MPDVFIETLHTWQNFYFMIGGVVAGLLGLMFVALSLMHLVSDETREEFEIFVTPSEVYFVSALLVACVMLVPALTPPSLALALFFWWRIGARKSGSICAINYERSTTPSGF